MFFSKRKEEVKVIMVGHYNDLKCIAHELRGYGIASGVNSESYRYNEKASLFVATEQEQLGRVTAKAIINKNNSRYSKKIVTIEVFDEQDYVEENAEMA